MITLPVPDSSCPTPDSSGNILDALGGVIGHLPVIGDVTKVAQMIGGMAKCILGWISDPGSMAHDVGGWLTFNLFGYNVDAPNCYQPGSYYGFARSVLLGDVRLDGSSIYQDAYSAMATAGMVIVLLAGMARVLRGASEREHHLGRTVVDVVPRVVLGFGGIALGFGVLDWILPLCSDIGAALLGQLAGIATGGMPDALQDPLGLALVGGVKAVLGAGLLATVLVPVMLLFLIRLLTLLIARFLIVSLAVAFTPLVIAIAVYDHRAAVVRWWLQMMAGAAITPIVCAGMLGITLGLSVRFVMGSGGGLPASPVNLTGSLVAIGGVWLTGKVIRALLFSSTGGQHEGTIAFLRHSVETAVAIPMAAGRLASMGGQVAKLGALAAGTVAGGPAGAAAVMAGGAMVAKSATTASAAISSPSTAFASFRTSSAGMALAQAATPHLPPGTPPSSRWAHLLGTPQLASATERLRTAVFTEATRTGTAAAPDRDRTHFIAAATALHSPRSAPIAAHEEATA
jgi:hypothetical protein